MKKLFLAIGMLLATGIVMAQDLEFGVKFGAGTAKRNIPSYNIDDISSNFKSNVGYSLHSGIFLRLQGGNLLFQPEVYYNFAHATMTETSSFGETTYKSNFSRLDIPFLIGKKFGPLDIKVGPVASILMGASQKAEFKDAFNSGQTIVTKNEDYKTLYGRDFKDNFSAARFGAQAGVGLSFGKILLDLRYEALFGKVEDPYAVLTTPESSINVTQQILLSVGYKFVK